MNEKYNMVVQNGVEKKMFQCPFWACVEKDDKLFFSAYLMNGLFCMDLESGRIDFLKRFETEEKEKYLHKFAFWYNNEIWFIPDKGKNITIINFPDLTMKKMELPDFDENINVEKFCACIQTGEKEVWLLPSSYKEIVIINLEKKTLRKIENWKRVISGSTEIPQFIDAIKVGDEIWLCPYFARDLVVINIETEEIRKEKWEFEPCLFQKMLYDEHNIWFISTMNNSYLLKWNIETGHKKEIPFPSELKGKDSVGYYALAKCDNYIWLAPFEAENFVKINIDTDEVEVVTSFYKIACSFGENNERYQIAVELEKRILFLSDCPGIAMFSFNRMNKVVTFYELAVDMDQCVKWLQATWNEKGTLKGTIFLNETGALVESAIPLEFYGELLKNPQSIMWKMSRDGVPQKEFGNSGEEIWEYVKRDLQNR